jgi:hypothetical protein
MASGLRSSLKTLAESDFIVVRGHTYDDLLPESTLVEIEPGVSVRVATLEAVITHKEEQASLADLAVLPTLRATLAEIRRRQSSSSTTSE